MTMRLLQTWCAVAVLVTTVAAGAQGDFGLIFNPVIGEGRVEVSISGDHSWTSDVKDRRTDFGMTRGQLQLRLKPWHSTRSEMLASVDYAHWDIDSRARLHESLRTVPGNLEDFSLGLGFRRRLLNDWMVGILGYGGSASDELFHSSDEVYGGATAFARVPSGNRNAWVFLVNYDSKREWPLFPGVGYLFSTDKWQGGVGLPFVFLRGRPCENLRIKASYTPVTNVELEITHERFHPVHLFGGFEWDSAGFFRAGRRNDEDRLHFEEKRVRAGARFYFTRDIDLELAGGYAFDRRFGEGEDRDDWYDNDYQIEDGAFASITFSGRF